jgi:hypothetical protein
MTAALPRSTTQMPTPATAHAAAGPANAISARITNEEVMLVIQMLGGAGDALLAERNVFADLAAIQRQQRLQSSGGRDRWF